ARPAGGNGSLRAALVRAHLRLRLFGPRCRIVGSPHPLRTVAGPGNVPVGALRRRALPGIGGPRRAPGGSRAARARSGRMTPLRTVRTMCPMNCHPTLCGMLVDVEDGNVKAARGDTDNPDSRGFLCIRGQAARE